MRHGNKSLHLPVGSSPFERSGLLKTGFFSLLLHMGLVLFLMLNLMSPYNRDSHAVYRVTLRPFSPPGDGNPPGGSRGASGKPGSPSVPPTVEKPAPEKISKGSETVETPRSSRKKMERAEKKEALASIKKQKNYDPLRETKLVEGLKKTDKKVERVERERGAGKSLQEAIDEIHKKAALDEIQKKVARRSSGEKRTEEEPSPSSSLGPVSSSSKGAPLIGSGTGTGSGKGTGTGTGTGTGSGSGSGGSPWGSAGLESKLNDYYSLIWTRIKEGWTLPENLPKEKADLEAIIIVVIEKGGKIQKSWFEKKSGNTLYDQMAMRAIKKAEPFPPIPKELSEDSLEIGIRFYPE
ncbi:MAG TPA: energy transducer TonB [Thermodesulfobacteriota bacterium]|nr:energy transducer TonB [Thermodesulfobacteriota bacterium]